MRVDDWVLEDAGIQETHKTTCGCGKCEYRNGMWWRGPLETDCLLTYVDSERWNYCPHCGKRLPLGGKQYVLYSIRV